MSDGNLTPALASTPRIVWERISDWPAGWVGARFFLAPLGHLPCTSLADADLPHWAVAANERAIVLGGKGPLWLYAWLVQQCQGFEKIAIEDPSHAGAVVVQSSASSSDPTGSVIQPVTNQSDRTATTRESTRPTWEFRRQGGAVRISLAAAGHFHPSILADPILYAMPDHPEGPGTVLLDGRPPIWLLSRLVIETVVRWPDASIHLYDPKLSGSVVVRTGPHQPAAIGSVLADATRGDPVPTVGIVGDPNSGKSVLSWKLYDELLRRGKNAYRFDCDAQAPTGRYSMTGLAGTEARAQYKARRGGWTGADDSYTLQVAHRLRGSSLDIAIFDLPGGLHRAGEPAIRIPQGRPDLFRECDGFILVAKDAGARHGWEQALEEHGLRSRIIAVVEPNAGGEVVEEFSGEGAGEGDRAWIGRIHRLDRRDVDIVTPAARSLAAHLLAWAKKRTVPR